MLASIQSDSRKRGGGIRERSALRRMAAMVVMCNDTKEIGTFLTHCSLDLIQRNAKQAGYAILQDRPSEKEKRAWKDARRP
jgi:hypothetical protein